MTVPTSNQEATLDRSSVSRRALLVGAAMGATGLTAGCGSRPPAPVPAPASAPTSGPTARSTPVGSSSPSPRPTPSRPPDPAKVHADELGVVPVMMYHRLTDQPGEYDITPPAFRRQVRRLLASGYRPVDAADLAHGRVVVPAGKTPVVLTFDDGSPGQFALRRDGRLDPGCAAGILAAECARVPGAEPRATFYVNRAPFGLTAARDRSRALRALLELGFSLGNHTLDHTNLGLASDGKVAEELVRLQRLVAEAAPAAELSTMALPFGVLPRHLKLARRGSWHGTRYDFAMTLLVGANPSPSPYAAAFDPHAVPRIRGTSWHGDHTPLTGRYWLDHLDDHPEERYVSAGNPGHVTVPRRRRHEVAARFHDRVVTY